MRSNLGDQESEYMGIGKSNLKDTAQQKSQGVKEWMKTGRWNGTVIPDDKIPQEDGRSG